MMEEIPYKDILMYPHMGKVPPPHIHTHTHTQTHPGLGDNDYNNLLLKTEN